MLKCENCGHVFEEDEIITVDTGVSYAGTYEQESVCPSCMDTAVEEAVECDMCGEWHFREEMDFELETVCDHCVRETKKRMLKQLESSASAAEYRIINYLLAG